MRKTPLTKGDEITAWLGEEVRIESGSLRFEGCLRVDGRVLDGKLTGENLVVGESGKVSGHVSVDTLEIYGDLEGRAEVKTSFELQPGASFRGELFLGGSELNVREGSRFHARVRTAGQELPPEER